MSVGYDFASAIIDSRDCTVGLAPRLPPKLVPPEVYGVPPSPAKVGASQVAGTEFEHEYVKYVEPVRGVRLGSELFAIPGHFGIIEQNVYRCAFPPPETYPFLERLQLKTIVNLLDRFPSDYREFSSAQGIKYYHVPVKGNKAHCEEMDRARAAQVLRIIIDESSHPVLIHCRSGKHRTGALVGCLRMLQNWTTERANDEYILYCQHKQRDVDKKYIERFDPRKVFGGYVSTSASSFSSSSSTLTSSAFTSTLASSSAAVSLCSTASEAAPKASSESSTLVVSDAKAYLITIPLSSNLTSTSEATSSSSSASASSFASSSQVVSSSLNLTSPPSPVSAKSPSKCVPWLPSNFSQRCSRYEELHGRPPPPISTPASSPIFKSLSSAALAALARAEATQPLASGDPTSTVLTGDDITRSSSSSSSSSMEKSGVTGMKTSISSFTLEGLVQEAADAGLAGTGAGVEAPTPPSGCAVSHQDAKGKSCPSSVFSNFGVGAAPTLDGLGSGPPSIQSNKAIGESASLSLGKSSSALPPSSEDKTHFVTSPLSHLHASSNFAGFLKSASPAAVDDGLFLHELSLHGEGGLGSNSNSSSATAAASDSHVDALAMAAMADLRLSHHGQQYSASNESTPSPAEEEEGGEAIRSVSVFVGGEQRTIGGTALVGGGIFVPKRRSLKSAFDRLPEAAADGSLKNAASSVALSRLAGSAEEEERVGESKK